MLNYPRQTARRDDAAHELDHGVQIRVLAAEQGELLALDAAHARRDRERLRGDADLPLASGEREGTSGAEGASGGQGERT